MTCCLFRVVSTSIRRTVHTAPGHAAVSAHPDGCHTAGALLAVCAVLVLALSGCASVPEAPQANAGREAVLSYAEGYLAHAARGLSVGGLGAVLVAEGKSVLVQGFGPADEARGLDIDADTVFRYGSITKLFTMLAVMQLVEEGRIELDEAYASYVPEFRIQRREAYAPFTVRNLLTHHAGIPGDVMKGWTAGPAVTGDLDEWATKYREIVPLLANEYATSPPETAFSYSNAGFALLGVLIERVSGLDYAEYLDRFIFTPLGMDTAGVFLDPEDRERLARGYPGGDIPPETFTYIRGIPAGGLFASLSDMGRFMEMWVREGAIPGTTERIIGQKTFAEIVTPQNTEVALDLDFSIGLTAWLANPTPVPDAHLASHGGDVPPFHAIFTSAPEEDLAVLTVTNSDAGADAMTDAAIEIMTRLLEHNRGRGYEQTPLPERSRVALPPEHAAELEGYWTGPLGLMEAGTRRGRLAVDTTFGTITATHRGEGYLTADVRILGIPVVSLHPVYFRLQSHEGRPMLGFYQQGIPTGYAVRFEPGPVPPSWRDRAGSYEIVNPDPVNSLQDPRLRYDEESGLLSVEVFALGLGATLTLPLTVVDEELALTGGVGRFAGEAIQVRRVDGEERIFYSGYEMRRVES